MEFDAFGDGEDTCEKNCVKRTMVMLLGMYYPFLEGFKEDKAINSAFINHLVSSNSYFCAPDKRS
eukprot:3271110-Amphidinium_carterae.1